MTTPCKHVFCRGCLDKVVAHSVAVATAEGHVTATANNHLVPCPLCRTLFRLPQLITNSTVYGEMLLASVACRRKSDGCTASICPLKYEEHEAQCQFVKGKPELKLYTNASSL
jgi:Zinc finger, C3HC4 type (RING finger)